MSENRYDLLSDKELKAIHRLWRAFEQLPKTLKVYNIDNEIVICKVGVSSSDLDIVVYDRINAGSMLSDLHDLAEVKP